MRKLLGYILMIIGVALIVIKFALKQLPKQIAFLSELNALWTVIIGAILIAIGVLSLKPGKGRHTTGEVPIYHGKNVVGYRRK